ncbi:MAG: polyhydroxyalkanoic acid system family protein [Acidobacteriota bacterium]
MELKVETAKLSMDDIKSALDAALKKEFPGGMLGRTWEGDVLKLSGPGASGSIQLESGALVGRAQLKPPASMMRAVIEEKISAAMKTAAA